MNTQVFLCSVNNILRLRVALHSQQTHSPCGKLFRGGIWHWGWKALEQKSQQIKSVEPKVWAKRMLNIVILITMFYLPPPSSQMKHSSSWSPVKRTNLLLAFWCFTVLSVNLIVSPLLGYLRELWEYDLRILWCSFRFFSWEFGGVTLNPSDSCKLKSKNEGKYGCWTQWFLLK